MIDDPVGDRMHTACPRPLEADLAGGGPADPIERVLEAASRMFYDHGPASITLKWVALASGVSYDEIAARWPSVEALLADVLVRMAHGVDEAVAAAIAEAGSERPVTTEESGPRGDLIAQYVQVVCRCLLDGINPATLDAPVPQVDRVETRFQEVFGLDERTARYRVAQTFALEWGWRLFSPHLLAACGLEDEPQGEPYRQMQALHQQIIHLPPVHGPRSEP